MWRTGRIAERRAKIYGINIFVFSRLLRREWGGIISRDADKRSAADACELMHVTSFSHLLSRAVHARKHLYPRYH